MATPTREDRPPASPPPAEAVGEEVCAPLWLLAGEEDDGLEPHILRGID